MPTYILQYRKESLTAAQKQAIAKAVTDTHTSNTGVQAFFAQVMFQEISSDDWFLGGEPMTGRHLFMLGYLRSGRSDELKAKLLQGFQEALVKHGEVPPERAWIYLLDVPAPHIFEYGAILPQMGQEKQWVANLTEAARTLLLTPTKK